MSEVLQLDLSEYRKYAFACGKDQGLEDKAEVEKGNFNPARTVAVCRVHVARPAFELSVLMGVDKESNRGEFIESFVDGYFSVFGITRN